MGQPKRFASKGGRLNLVYHVAPNQETHHGNGQKGEYYGEELVGQYGVALLFESLLLVYFSLV